MISCQFKQSHSKKNHQETLRVKKQVNKYRICHMSITPYAAYIPYCWDLRVLWSLAHIHSIAASNANLFPPANNEMLVVKLTKLWQIWLLSEHNVSMYADISNFTHRATLRYSSSIAALPQFKICVTRYSPFIVQETNINLAFKTAISTNTFSIFKFIYIYVGSGDYLWEKYVTCIYKKKMIRKHKD